MRMCMCVCVCVYYLLTTNKLCTYRKNIQEQELNRNDMMIKISTCTEKWVSCMTLRSTRSKSMTKSFYITVEFE